MSSALSYFLLRRLIGILGITLPLVLPLGTWLASTAHAWQPSISHYYYSVMHLAFVGVLCVLGCFLLCYRTGKYETLLASVAGGCAVGVALFPTCLDGFLGTPHLHLAWHPGWVSAIHYINAGVLFGCFTVFCFKFFQEADDGSQPVAFDHKKKFRNALYRWCGWIILLSMAAIGGIALYEWQAQALPWSTYTTFIFETTSLLAFGTSWLVKGTYQLTPQSKSLKWMLSVVR